MHQPGPRNSTNDRGESGDRVGHQLVSELTRPAPGQAVIDWVDAQDSLDLVITALTAAEIRAGVLLLPSGRRQREIGRRMESLITDTFARHVLALDVDSSPHYASILAIRTPAGRPIGGLDAQIAAVCAQHDASLATRNTADFEGIGLHLIDPWKQSRPTPEP